MNRGWGIEDDARGQMRRGSELRQASRRAKQRERCSWRARLLVDGRVGFCFCKSDAVTHGGGGMVVQSCGGGGGGDTLEGLV